jgi:outer membrane protein assembly factor BamB
LVFFALLLAISNQRLPAQDWTRFRGPNGTGVVEDVEMPVAWTADDYKWRVELPGIGHSSPVVWGSQVFVTSARQEDGTRLIRCLDTSDGSLNWEREYPSTTFELNNATAFDVATPTVDGDRVYVAWCTPEKYTVLALDKEKGKEVWRRELEGPFEGDHNFGSSPVLFHDLLILQNDQSKTSFVVAFDASTGQTRWKTDRRTVKNAYSTSFILQPGTGPPQLILACSAYGVNSLDPRSGELNWEMPDLFGEIRVVGSPVAAGGLIFSQCGAGGGGKRMVAVRPGNPEKGTDPIIAYELKGSLPYVPTPVAHGELLFFISDGGVATCIEASSGEIQWRERVGGNYFGSPVRVGDRIYCVSRAGEVAVFAAGKEFRLLGKVDLGEPSHSTPAVADGVMYLRTFSHLMALEGN